MLLLDGCFILVNIDKNIGSVSETIFKRTVSRHLISPKLKQGISTFDMTMSQRSEDYVMENALLKSEVGEFNTSEGRPMEGKVEADKLVDSYFGGVWCCNYCWHDMLLLENQIPLMVVVKIYELLVVGNDLAIEAFRQKAAECMEDVLSSYPIAIQEYNRPRNAQHLLHLCHMYLRPSQIVEYNRHELRQGFFHRFLQFGHSGGEGNEPNALPAEQVDWLLSGDQPSRWRRAEQYHEAGVGFKRRYYNEHNRHSLLDIKFSNGNIEVPFFPIDENTESLFKNLIAFEQMDPRFGNDITTYIIFMSQFVSNPDDVTLLTQRGILVHMLDSDDEVSALFTRLTRNVAFNPDSYSYLQSLCNALECHYQTASPAISLGIGAGEPSFMSLRTATLGFVEVADSGTWRVVADGGMAVAMSKMAMAKAAFEPIVRVGFEGRINPMPPEATKVVQMNELANSMKKQLDYYWSQGEGIDNGMKSCLVHRIQQHIRDVDRNVIALEQTCPQLGDDFTAYIVLMSQLMSAPEDVTLLARNKNIVHHLDSDDEASDLFTLLSKDVVFDFNAILG
ncbi:hypothetical protein PR202_gb14150 [Eleusine coracana subsp. coracana]|uniref:Uncharacterized protein n=1 Tax=Eleusine coracana subsp. coracana TaxID=191504 RepID=A0AAV5ES37_ELECO|nr:hypothetical protein PR202_gb14150 [Eleusine coracana subsp. coracana]